MGLCQKDVGTYFEEHSGAKVGTIWALGEMIGIALQLKNNVDIYESILIKMTEITLPYSRI